MADEVENQQPEGKPAEVEAEAKPEAKAAKRKPTGRDLDIENLAKARRNAVAEEIGEPIADPESIEPVDETEADKAETAEEEQPTAEKPPVEEPAKPAVQMVSVTIDGETKEVPFDEVVRSYQKGGAADKRLAEATRLLEAAKTKVEGAETPKEQAKAEAEVQKAAEVVIDAAAAKKKLFSALFDGDEAGADAAFDDAVTARVDAKIREAEERMSKGRMEATLSPEVQAEIDKRVEAKAQEQKQQAAVERALEKSKADYPEMYASPLRERVAAQMITEHMNDPANPVPFDKALELIGSEFVKEYRQTQTERPKVDDLTTARAERLAKKQGIDEPAATNARRIAPGMKTDVELSEAESRAKAILELTKSRPGAAA